MQIRTFTKDNIGLLFLSAYIEVFRGDGSISFRNALFEEPMTIQVENDRQVDLLRKLDEGVTPQEAAGLFAECLRRNSKNAVREEAVLSTAGLIVKNMMARGILE